MRYLVVVPARGGSKGIKKKNIVPICGKPLLEYTLETAIAAKINGDIVVSTDAEDIAEVAKNNGIEVIPRPKEIAGDTASTEVALIHALDYMKQEYGKEYDAVITMQATSPLRTKETINAFLKAFEDNIDKYDALLTLHEDRTDFWVEKEDNQFERLYPNAPRRRQERKPLFVENSCIYVTLVSSLKETKSVLGNRTNGFVIPAEEGIDINEPRDIIIAESFITSQHKTQE